MTEEKLKDEIRREIYKLTSKIEQADKKIEALEMLIRDKTDWYNNY
jgi:peptidoglycan hydrolase CwlO-like protein